MGGPRPRRSPGRPNRAAAWEDRAGWAEIARALGGVDSDADPLGTAPPAGAVEHHAVFRTAHHVLNRPEAGADEAEASDGQLRARARAGERIRDWLPAHVDDELAATSQAADQRAADAALWSARAAVEDDPATRDRFRADADQARADAERLAGLREQLEEVATGRDEALAHTAVTRDRAERAKLELAIRGIDRDDPTGLVTAEEWLAAREEAERSEDPHREVTDERDLADAAAARTAAHEAAVHGADPAEATDDAAASTDDVDPANQLSDEVATTATHRQRDSARDHADDPARNRAPATDGDKDERATPDPARGADAAAGKADRRTEQRTEDHDAPGWPAAGTAAGPHPGTGRPGPRCAPERRRAASRGCRAGGVGRGGRS
jgi:hypothetical protein